MFCFYLHLVLFVYEVHNFRNRKVFWRRVSLSFFPANFGKKEAVFRGQSVFVGALFLLCLCVFFVSCASIRFNDGKQFSLAAVFITSSLCLFLFYIRYCGNFCDVLYGRPILVLRCANLLLSNLELL